MNTHAVGNRTVWVPPNKCATGVTLLCQLRYFETYVNALPILGTYKEQTLILISTSGNKEPLLYPRRVDDPNLFSLRLMSPLNHFKLAAPRTPVWTHQS
jgi:hypothetical protein